MTDQRKKYFTVVQDHFPDELAISFGGQTLRYRKRTWAIPDPDSGETVERGLRYGENPDQEAALYELCGGNLALGGVEYVGPGKGVVSAIDVSDMLQVGKHPGKTNLTDVDNALNILRYLVDKPAVAIMKHNNPCGVAEGETVLDAYRRAYMADRIAAMGGAVVMNRACDRATAAAISDSYVEVVAAPDYEEGAADALAARKNLRILRLPGIHKLGAYQDLRFVEFKALMDGGIIVQQSQANAIHTAADLQPAVARHQGREYRMKRQPTAAELADMLFGWRVEMGVTSNSVLYVKNGATVAIGAGEQDRVGVAEIAVFKAYKKFADALCFERHGVPYWEFAAAVDKGEKPAAELAAIDAETREKKAGLAGSVMVSDAFFPFRDGVEVGIREGVTAVVQPGGAMRDWDVIDACNEAGVAMMFTGQRAFKH